MSVAHAFVIVFAGGFLIWFCRCSPEEKWEMLPKGLPAKMSSLWDAAAVAALAYDGNTDGSYLAGVRCVCNRGGEPEPWWMLDMLQNYRVAGVRVWNRLDSTVETRFTQISIGVSFHESVWTKFNSSLFSLCAYKAVALLTDADNPISMNCDALVAGRYLAVYKNLTGMTGTNIYLNFCEIDIFTVREGMALVGNVVQPSFSTASASLLSTALKMRSDIECITECSKLRACIAVLFKVSSHDCWFFGYTSIPSSFIGVLGNGGDSKFIAIRA